MCALSGAPGSRGCSLTGSVLPDSHSLSCLMKVFPWLSMWHLCTEQGRGTRATDPLQLNGVPLGPPGCSRKHKHGHCGSRHNVIPVSGEGALGAATF